MRLVSLVVKGVGIHIKTQAMISYRKTTGYVADHQGCKTGDGPIGFEMYAMYFLSLSEKRCLNCLKHPDTSAISPLIIMLNYQKVIRGSYFILKTMSFPALQVVVSR